MVNVEAKTRLIRRRAAALTLPGGAVEQVEAIAKDARTRLTGEALRVEWLNDMVAHESAAEFGLAARDPGRHFIEWAKARVRRRYHVSYRSVEVVSRRFGIEIATRLSLIVWPQEISWAQRLRLDPNPTVATKAALFLREAEGNPGKTFERLSDVYADAALRSDYVDHPAHGIGADEIRFAAAIPDFTPLFLRHAARAYAELLLGMPRERLVALAGLAARAEREERAAETSLRSIRVARSSPMRRMLPIVSAARSLGISSNDLCLLERAFLAKIEQGDVVLEPEIGSPHAAFASVLGRTERRSALLAEAPQREIGEDPDSLAWTVVRLGRGWIRDIPDAYRRLTNRLPSMMEAWQGEIGEDLRPPPLDPVSDFAFFLFERGTGASR